MRPPRPVPILLVVVTITLAVLVGDARAGAAVTEEARTAALAATGRVGIDLDGRWFALFAGAFLLLPARRARRSTAPDDRRASDDRHGTDDRADGRPRELPAAGLEDLDPEVMTAVLRVWADR